VFEIPGFVSGVGLTLLGVRGDSTNELVDSGGEFLDRLGDS
jgi:hypothetical protein